MAERVEYQLTDDEFAILEEARVVDFLMLKWVISLD
jgi:hypothetical protein